MQRFWSKVSRGDPNKCWLWQAATNRKGYGVFWWGSRRTGGGRPAHRVAWFLTHNWWPEVVRHTCDNPPCQNPNHLLAGNHADNVRDMDRRGRRGTSPGDANGSRKHPERLLRGEQHWNTTLTSDDIRAIRAMHAAGSTMKGLARQFDVGASTIGRIVLREVWGHVE